MIEGGAAIEAVTAEYAAAVLAKEPARLAALYAPDVRVFDAWGVWSYDDRDAWGRNLEDWLGSLGNEGVQVQFDDVCLVQRAETSSFSAIVTYSAVDAAGNVVRSMQNRLSWFLTKIGGRWVVAHEHTSAPIGFDNQKAILRRD
jgi:ketosteroid isomerase-like protein